MNLGTLATAVGQRLGVNTSSGSTRDGAAVRQFLTMRHNQLWKSFLWKDSIIEFVLNLNSPYGPLSNYMPTKNRIILPPIFQNVLGVRLGDRAIDVQRPMLFYRADYSVFFRLNYCCQFELLPSCVWEFDTVQSLAIANANITDSNQPVTVDELQSDGVSVSRNIYNTMPQVGTPIQSTDRIDNLLKPVTQGSVTLGIQAQPTDFTGNNGVNLPPPNIVYQLAVQSGGDNFQVGQIIVVIAPGFQATFIVNQITPETPMLCDFLGAPGDSPTGTPFPVAGQPIYVTPIYSGANAPITLSAGQTQASKSQRIQLVGKPSSRELQHPCRVLGRRSTPTYVSDNDVPGVDGFSEILFNLAYYDFLCRDERGGTSDAQSALNEAVGPNFLSPQPGQQGKPGGWLGKLIELETVQAAYNTRIIPDGGFGGDRYYGRQFEGKWVFTAD